LAEKTKFALFALTYTHTQTCQILPAFVLKQTLISERI